MDPRKLITLNEIDEALKAESGKHAAHPSFMLGMCQVWLLTSNLEILRLNEILTSLEEPES